MGLEHDDVEHKQNVGLLRAAMGLVLEPIFELLQNDPHQWSRRPCLTCRTISTMVGRKFGCLLYAEQRKGE